VSHEDFVHVWAFVVVGEVEVVLVLLVLLVLLALLVVEEGADLIQGIQVLQE
jgi:hypothetical protein